MEFIAEKIRERLKSDNSYITQTILPTPNFLDLPKDRVKSLDKKLLHPVLYFLSRRSKHSLPVMYIEAFNHWIKAPQDSLNLIKEMCKLGEAVILLIDDVQDESMLRRGYPCSYLVYGSAETINAVHFLHAEIGKMLFESNLPENYFGCEDRSQVYRILDESKDKKEMLRKKGNIYYGSMLDALRGQATEMYWRSNAICPTIEEYLTMILRKTGMPLMMLINILNIDSTHPREDIDYMYLLSYISTFVQIKDDYQNIFNAEYQKTKGFCEDVTEGKFGFPSVYVINKFPEKEEVLKNILQQRTHNVELLNYYRTILKECGADVYTWAYLESIKKKILEEYNKLDANPLFEKLFLDDLLIIDKAMVI